MVSAKEKLRQQALQTRADMSEKERTEASQKALEQFLVNIIPADGAIVALYWPMGSELDCRGLMDRLGERGHKICLPVVVGRDKPLIFRLWDGRSALEKAPFGTRVPAPDAEEAEPDLIVLPLAGFDKKGTRLGYGKGYYDRTIATMVKKPALVGLAFASQELDYIPAAPHDVPLHRIVTQNGVIDFEQNTLRQESEIS